MANCSVQQSLRLIEDLKFFLATAPANWQESQVIRRYYLNHDEGFVSCVFWNNLYFITGTDIVRCIVYKFEHFGRKIIDRKKFEEGVFSDLRNLKCGTDAILENPRLEFLDFLFKNSCLRTQKKQKVFFWFNVPHDKLMADALERDLKKERHKQAPTTVAHREPAASFVYDDRMPLILQLAQHFDRQLRLNNVERIEAQPVLQAQTQLLARVRQPVPHEVPPVLQTDEGYDFLHHDTPVQYRDDEETDFPLDYFDTEDLVFDGGFAGVAAAGGGAASEYFNVEVGSGGDEFETYIDPAVFAAPTAPLVHNNEFLIEQTQPLRSAKLSAPPLAARYYSDVAASPVKPMGRGGRLGPPQPPWGDAPLPQYYQEVPYVAPDVNYWPYGPPEQLFYANYHDEQYPFAAEIPDFGSGAGGGGGFGSFASGTPGYRKALGRIGKPPIRRPAHAYSLDELVATKLTRQQRQGAEADSRVRGEARAQSGASSAFIPTPESSIHATEHADDPKRHPLHSKT